MDIETPRLLLRPLSPADVTGEYVQGLNDPEVNRFLVDVRRQPQTRQSVCRYVEDNRSGPDRVLMGMFLKACPDRPSGTVRISSISCFHACADVGICIFRKSLWGMGYGTESLDAVCRVAFERIGLRYLEAGVYEKNTASRKAFERSGFVQTHRIEDKYRLEDSFEPVLFLAARNSSFSWGRFHGKERKA